VILGAICLSIVLGYFAYTYFFKEEKKEEKKEGYYSSMGACPMSGCPINHSSLEEPFQPSHEDAMQTSYQQEEYYNDVNEHSEVEGEGDYDGNHNYESGDV
jgi:hypothetical protein